MFSRTVLCLAIVSASDPLLADTVWLKNGDKLSGKIILFDGGKLLIQTESPARSPIDWKQVKTLESDQELLVKQDAYTGEKAKSLHAAEDGKVILANGEAPQDSRAGQCPTDPQTQAGGRRLVWKGNDHPALDYQRADKDTDDYDIDFKTSARHGQLAAIAARANSYREFQDHVITTGQLAPWNTPWTAL